MNKAKSDLTDFEAKRKETLQARDSYAAKDKVAAAAWDSKYSADKAPRDAAVADLRTAADYNTLSPTA